MSLTVFSDALDVAVLAPTGRDGPLIVDLLTAQGLLARVVEDGEALLAAMSHGIGAAIVTEEALPPRLLTQLKEQLVAQPAWSDLPMILLSGRGVVHAERPLASLAPLGNVTVLDRPVQTRTLVTAVEAALRARCKQYAARRAIEERDRFLAMLGHELRNPLAAILFAAESSRRGGSAAGRGLETIERQARHLSRLVDDLLDVSRVTSGKIVLERQPVELGELVQRSVATLDGWIQARRMRLIVAPPGEPTWVTGDAVRLEQVFVNLLTNAIKYTPEHGEIRLSVGSEDGEQVVRIRDSGVGLPPDMLSGIFELFAQVEGTIDRASGGLGLGLTLVRSLVKLHGGRVQAFSEGVGHGSEFVVWLPRAKELPVNPPPPPPPRPSPPSSRGLTLVVVEDNTDIREMLTELLEDEGHRVEAARDGAAGLSLIVEHTPDLALVDLGLPKLDGYQVAEQVRQKLGDRVWLVALSGYGQPEDKARSRGAGFNAHLTKPISVDGLRSVLADVAR